MKAFSSKKITFDISNKVDQCSVQKLNPLCITHKIMQLEQNFQICCVLCKTQEIVSSGCGYLI